jgi:hypothetical protein
MSDAVLSGNFDDVLGIGGFRSGKTSEGVRIATELAVRYPGNRILITRKYSVDYQSTIAPVIREIIPDAIIVKEPTSKDPYYTIRTQGNKTSDIWCMGLYGTDRKRIGKIKGQSFGSIIVDQAEELDQTDIDLLKARLSLKAMPFHVLLLLANPPNIGHCLHTRFEIERSKGRRAMFNLPTEANKDNIPPDYIEKLKEDYQDRPGWVQAYLNGTWGYTVIGDAAFKGFKDLTHILTIPYDKNVEIVRSWDFGWKHPSVSWYQRKAGGGLHKLKEHMGDKILITDFGRAVVTMTNEFFPGAKCEDFGDHAGNQKNDKDNQSSIGILKRDYGIEVKTKPNTSIDATIDLVQKNISSLNGDGQPRFTCDPSCRITIDALQGGYSRDENGEVIKDGFFEHVVDTDRYVVYNLYGNQITGARQSAKNIKIRSATYGFGRPK